MSLENVKVGDRVWLGQFNHRGLWKRLNLDEIVAVTAKKFRVKRHPKDLYDKRTGADYKGAQYCYYAIATLVEIEAWNAEQAKTKADAEAAEAQRQQEQKERQKHLCELHEFVLKHNGGEFVDLTLENAASTFWFRGRRYEIRGVSE